MPLREEPRELSGKVAFVEERLRRLERQLASIPAGVQAGETSSVTLADVTAAIAAHAAGDVRDGDAAGGVLGGTYPNPSFAVDMATQAELNAVAAAAVNDGDAAGGVLAGTYPNPSFAVDMATQAELDAHITDATAAHAASAISFSATGNIASTDVQAAIAELDSEKAPASVDYLVGTASGGLSGEIVVGTTPGGELGGTWAAPTVDATHSGSAHADFIAKAFFAAKGDILTASANDTPALLTVGANGTILVADSGEATGLKWTTALTVTALTDSGLTPGRVVIAGASGLLADDADLTFSGSTLSATNVAVTTTLTVGTPETTIQAYNEGVFGAGRAATVWRDTTNDIEGVFVSAASSFFAGSASNHPFVLVSNGAVRMTIAGTGEIKCTTAFYPSTPALAIQLSAALFAGVGAPNNANGNNGDYYLRSDGGVGTHLYFKAAGAWAGII